MRGLTYLKKYVRSEIISNLIFFPFHRPDVYILTVTQMLQYMTEPKELREVNQIESWKCDKNIAVAPKPCNIWQTCALPFKIPEQNVTDTRYMETCRECPNVYPWLGDAGGTGISGRDNYIFSAPNNSPSEEDDEANQE